MKKLTPGTIQYYLDQIRQLEESICLPDDLLIVTLRFHLVSENLLERFLKAKLPRGAHLVDNARLTYAQKLSVADSLGVIEPEVIIALSRLNSLRNKCAHEQGQPVSLHDLDHVGEPFALKLSVAKPDPDETELNQVGVAAGLFARIQERLLRHLAPLELPDTIK